MHVGIALDLEQPRDGDAAHLAHTREVVAHEVDDHEVLGLLFVARGELGGERRIALDLGVARARALDGAGLHDPVGDAQEGLGARAQQGGAPDAHEGAVVGGTRPAQPPIDGQRVEGHPVCRLELGLGREAQLVGIAVANAALARAHQVGVVLVSVAPRERRRGRLGLERGDGC